MAINVTDTLIGGFDSVADDQQASGSSLFWALTAIVLNAMLQPSFCGYLLNGDAFEGSIWPHRSSPTICLIDTVAELWILAEKCGQRRLDNHARHGVSAAAKPTAVVLRLAIFFLAVLPQAVKLFSMQGVYAAQVLGAVFLVPSIVSMVRAIGVDAPQQDICDLLGRLEKAKKAVYARAAVAVLGWGLHGIGMIGVWYKISGRVHVSATKDVQNAMDWMRLAISVYMMQHIAITLTGFKPPIPRYPLLVILLYTNNLGVGDILKDPSARRQQGYEKVTLASILLLNVCLCSYAIVCLLEAFAKVLLRGRRSANANDGNGPELPRSGQDIVAESEGGEPAALSQTSTAVPDETETFKAEVSEAFRSIVGISSGQARIETVVESSTSNAGTNDSSGSGESSTMHRESTTRGSSIDEKRGDDGQAGAATQQAPETAPTPQGGNDRLPFFLWPFVFISVGCIIVARYAGFWTEEDGESGSGSAAERGAAEPSTNKREHASRAPEQVPTTEASLLSRALVLINVPLKFAVRWALILVGRFFLGVVSLLGYTLSWIMHHLRRQPKDKMVLAFGVVNFATAIMYYLVVFDGEGTFAPWWTGVLGR